MPRTHGRVLCSIWSNDDFVTLGPESQRTFLLLISQPDLSHAGVLPYVPGRWARLAHGTPLETVEKAIAKLEASRFVIVDRDTAELLIRTFVVHDGGLANPKMRGAIRSALKAIHSDVIRKAVLDVVPPEHLDDINGLREPDRKATRSQSDPDRNGDPNATRSDAEVGGRDRRGVSSRAVTGESARKRATPPPDDFTPDDALQHWAKREAPGVDIYRETQAWIDWCKANGRTYRDHRAGWRTWMRRAVSRNGEAPIAGPPHVLGRGLDAEPTWDLDEHGDAIPRAIA